MIRPFHSRTASGCWSARNHELVVAAQELVGTTRRGMAPSTIDSYFGPAADNVSSVPEVLRYAAFSQDPAAGNPAGVVLDAGGLRAAEMLATVAEAGYSETAFVTADDGDCSLVVRYFS